MEVSSGKKPRPLRIKTDVSLVPTTRKKSTPSPMDAYCFTDTVDPRHIITSAGEKILLEAYRAASFSTPTQSVQRQLAARLNVTLAAVKRWFQNRDRDRECDRDRDSTLIPTNEVEHAIGIIERRMHTFQTTLDSLECHQRKTLNN